LSLIYILCSVPVYEAAKEAGMYAPDSLQLEGFIHASPAHQLNRVANKYYRQYESLCLLTVETDKVSAEIKWEAISNGDLYPHIYGPLNMNAVIQVTQLNRNASQMYEIDLP
jgi:uncharacterized protein (DUF952 family)